MNETFFHIILDLYYILINSVCVCVCLDLIILCSFDLSASDLGQKLAVFLIKT